MSSKTFSRCICMTSWRRFLKTSWRRLVNTSWRHLVNTSWRRLVNTSWKRLAKKCWRRVKSSWDVFRRGFANTFWRSLEDALEDEKLLHWRRLWDVFRTSWKTRNVCSAVSKKVYRFYKRWVLSKCCSLIYALLLGIYSEISVRFI